MHTKNSLIKDIEQAGIRKNGLIGGIGNGR